MKHPHRPAWMGPKRRVQENKPVQGLTAAPKAYSQGYDPYDTVNTRKLDPDVWQGKPKRD